MFTSRLSLVQHSYKMEDMDKTSQMFVLKYMICYEPQTVWTYLVVRICKASWITLPGEIISKSMQATLYKHRDVFS